MIPLHHDPHFTFRFADDRLIPRFHLEGVEAGRWVAVYKINPDSGERISLLAKAAGWAFRSRSSCGPVKSSLPSPTL